MFPHPEDEAYNEFIRTILENGEVYTLSLEGQDVAECPSAVYDGDDGEPVPVFCVWQDEAGALACRAEEWHDYDAETVPLADFLYDWLIGMDQDEVLVGIDFDPQLYGLEIEPVELLGDILDAAGQMGIRLEDEEELMRYRLEWERMMSGQSRLN